LLRAVASCGRRNHRPPTSRPDPRRLASDSGPAASRHLSGWEISHGTGFTASLPPRARPFAWRRRLSRLDACRMRNPTGLCRRRLHQMPGAWFSARKPRLRNLPVRSAEASDHARGGTRADRRIRTWPRHRPAVPLHPSHTAPLFLPRLERITAECISPPQRPAHSRREQ
jgi:hypothetical protein